MKIGIIGAGNIGGTLTRRLAALGHEVSVANSRGPEALAALANETGAKAVTAREAARAGYVVVVTIPEAKIRDLPKDLFAGVSSDVVMIDTGNYYSRERDGRIEEKAPATSPVPPERDASARLQSREGPRAWIFTALGSSDFRFGLPLMAMSRASSVCSISSKV